VDDGRQRTGNGRPNGPGEQKRWDGLAETASLEAISKATEAVIGPPFRWCHVPSGSVRIQDASDYDSKHKGTAGGTFKVGAFAIAKYPVTNAQYRRFVDAPNGQPDMRWWMYSAEATRWRKDRPKPKQTAFAGGNVSRTRVSWFDSMAFCAWLSSELESRSGVTTEGRFDVQDVDTWSVRLPTEQEWQRAAVGDTDWRYPWGDELTMAHANFGNHVGQPVEVGSYPNGQSLYGVMDMAGNLWEWCLTRWGKDSNKVNGYIYRVVKGGAWNVSNPEHLCATDRAGLGPRARLNDGGFRLTLCLP